MSAGTLWPYIIAIVLIFFQQKMTVNPKLSNAILAATWALLLYALSQTPPINKQLIVPRLLWVLMIGSGIGLILHQLFWTPIPSKMSQFPGIVVEVDTVNKMSLVGPVIAMLPGGSPRGDPSRGALIMVYVRLINRMTRQVGLSAELTMQIRKLRSGKKESYVFSPENAPPPEAGTQAGLFLNIPLNIPPHTTINGYWAFHLAIPYVNDAGGIDGIIPQNLRLTEYISGATKEFPISGPDTEVNPRDKLAQFHVEGEHIRESIYEDGDESHNDDWWRTVSAWRTKTGIWLVENLSQADAMLFAATVTVDMTRQHRFRGQVLSNAKESVVQHMNEYISRLQDIMRRVPQ